MSPARFATVALLALLCAAPAQAATRGGVSMEILVDGRPLDELAGNGKTYVEARKGRNYTIALRNDTPRRVAVALAVDGLNSIDAKRTAARDAAKWVIGPYETVRIEGWQVDDAHARRFVFTSEEKSYGAYLGETKNLGVISAVFYGERGAEVCCVEPRGGSLGRGWGGMEREEDAAAPSAPRREQKSAGASAPAPEASARSSADVAAAPRSKKADEFAATGMGNRTRHDVQWTSFDLDPSPLASFETRYAYRDELLSLGVDPDWSSPAVTLRRREQASGFAPDPGASCCR